MGFGVTPGYCSEDETEVILIHLSGDLFRRPQLYAARSKKL